MALQRKGLTAQQMRILMSTWPSDSKMEEIVATAMLALFNSYPELLILYDSFETDHIRQLERDPAFKQLVRKIAKVIQETVERQENPEVVEKGLHFVGDVHRAKGVLRQVLVLFTPYLVSAVKHVLHDKLVWSDEVQMAWAAFFNLIILVMCEHMDP
jgi:hemoglobin-like flavoprotein